jgi:hypothetical protein
MGFMRDLLCTGAPWVAVIFGLLVFVVIFTQRGGDYSGAPAEEDCRRVDDEEGPA